MKKLSRRDLFRTTAAGAAALAAARLVDAQEEEKPPTYGDYLREQDKGNETIDATEDNIEGPFFRANAPWRAVLYDKGEKGDKLVVAGKAKARNGRALKEAVLEVWQADADGRYDNDDPRNQPAEDEFKLRGRIKATEEGAFNFETIRPGRYKIGPRQFRPAHIHIKVHAKGYKSLTTQLYFKDDPENKTDPWFKKSLIVDYKKDEESGKFTGAFDFVLPRA